MNNTVTMKVSNVSLIQRMKYFVKDNWKKIAIVLALITAFFVCMTFCGFWDGDYSDYRGGLGEFAVSMYKEVYGGGGIEKLSHKLNVTVNDSGLTLGDQTFAVGNIFTNINDILVGIATSIFVILWLCSLLTAFVNQQAYGELIVKKLMVLGIGVALICQANAICQEFCNFGSALTEVVASEVTENLPKIDEDALWDEMNCVNEDVELEDEPAEDEDKNALVKIWESIKTMFTNAFSLFGKMMSVKIINPLKYILVLLLPWAGIKIATILCSVFVYTRGVEIAILCALSPIPFAIISNDPFGNGTGARFLKNVAAVSLQGAVMMITFVICNAMVSGLSGGSITIEALSSNTMDVLIVYFAEVGLLMKSLSISQKVLGLA